MPKQSLAKDTEIEISFFLSTVVDQESQSNKRC